MEGSSWARDLQRTGLGQKCASALGAGDCGDRGTWDSGGGSGDGALQTTGGMVSGGVLTNQL